MVLLNQKPLEFPIFTIDTSIIFFYLCKQKVITYIETNKYNMINIDKHTINLVMQKRIAGLS